MAQHNKKRTERFRSKSSPELKAIAKSGSLSSAAAKYELDRSGESWR